jgi:DNA-binding transcriptional ArsR family regulator
MRRLTRRGHAQRHHLVDEPVLDGVLRGHEAVAVDVLHDLLLRLAGMSRDDRCHSLGHLQNLARRDLNVRRAPAEAAGPLVRWSCVPARSRFPAPAAAKPRLPLLAGSVEPTPLLPDVFDALGDPSRRFLLETLSARGEATATQLAAELPVTRQAVSKHLAALARAGLVTSERAGRETQYRVTPAPLEAAIEWMARVGGEWDARLARLRSHLDR